MKAVTRYIYLFLALLAVTSCKKDNNFTQVSDLDFEVEFIA